VGNGTDIVIGDYNARELYFHGDFRTGYTDGKLSIEASLPNVEKDFYMGCAKRADEASFMPLPVTFLPGNKMLEA